MIDLVMLFAVGLVGLTMRRFGLPLLPAVIGVILGPSAEGQLRRALQLSSGDLDGLVNTTFSVVVYAVIAVILLWPLIGKLVRRRSRPSGPSGPSGPSAGAAEREPEKVDA